MGRRAKQGLTHIKKLDLMWLDSTIFPLNEKRSQRHSNDHIDVRDWRCIEIDCLI
jgi:hypothetical protein